MAYMVGGDRKRGECMDGFLGYGDAGLITWPDEVRDRVSALDASHRI
jgi:hypothetical protein